MLRCQCVHRFHEFLIYGVSGCTDVMTTKCNTVEIDAVSSGSNGKLAIIEQHFCVFSVYRIALIFLRSLILRIS